MKRREFITLLGGAAAWPLAARAAADAGDRVSEFRIATGLRHSAWTEVWRHQRSRSGPNLLKISVSREVALVFGHHEGPTPTRGYEATRWRRFPKSWRRAAGADRVPGKGRSSTTLAPH